AEIVNARSAGTAPILMGVALALGSIVSFVLAIGSSVRARRRDLALLTTLGFTRRQLRAAVAWHATVLILGGLVIGVPLGVVVGRAMWRAFAADLDVDTGPTVPVLLIATLALAAVAVANAAAAFHSARIRRSGVSAALRAE